MECGPRAGDLLCRACFEALPEVESPCCAPFGLPTAFETFVCEECKNVDFGFEGARTPLRYEGAGKQIVHALKYGGYTRVAEKVAAPSMLGVLDGKMRFDRWCLCRCTAPGSGRGGSTRQSSWPAASPVG